MASANDIKSAQQTYSAFIGLLKISVPVLAVLTAFVVWLIS